MISEDFKQINKVGQRKKIDLSISCVYLFSLYYLQKLFIITFMLQNITFKIFIIWKLDFSFQSFYH